MVDKWWSYEPRGRYLRRVGNRWRTEAEKAVMQAMARVQLTKAGYNPDTVAGLQPSITTDVSDVGEPVPPTRAEKKSGGGFFSRIKDVAGDVTETVFRGPINEPLDIFKPLVKAGEWETEHIGKPAYRASVSAIITPKIALTEDVNLKEAWSRAQQRVKKLPVWLQTVGGTAMSPTTLIPGPGEAKGLVKALPGSAEFMAKMPSLSALFKGSLGSRRAFAAATAVEKSGDFLTTADRVSNMTEKVFFHTNPQAALDEAKQAVSVLSKTRNYIGSILPDSVVQALGNRGIRLLDDDTTYAIHAWAGMREAGDSIAAADAELMRLPLSKIFRLDESGHVLNVEGNPLLGDLILDYKNPIYKLTSEQKAAIIVSHNPVGTAQEVKRAFGILKEEKTPSGLWVHRQAVTRPATVIDPHSLEAYETVKEAGPLIRTRLGAKQPVSFPKMVATQAEGEKLGVTYLPYVESQALGIRQSYYEVADKWLLDQLGVEYPAVLQEGLKTAAKTLGNYRKLEKAIIAYQKAPTRGGFVRPRMAKLAEEAAPVTRVPATGKPYIQRVFRGVSGATPVDEGALGKGTYFTTSRSYAAQYAEVAKAQYVEGAPGKAGEVLEGTIRLDNPFVTSSSAELEELGGAAFRAARAERRSLPEALEAQSKEIRRVLESRGHDGVVLKLERTEEVIAFHPETSFGATPPKDQFSEMLTAADAISHLSHKADRLEGMDALLNGTVLEGKRVKGVRELMVPAKVAAREARTEFIAGRKLAGAQKLAAAKAVTEGPFRGQSFRALDMTLNRVNNEFRPVMATLDQSFAGIQGIFALARRLDLWGRAYAMAVTHPASYAEYLFKLDKSGQLSKWVGEWGLKIYSRDDFGEFAIRGISRHLPGAGLANRWFGRFNNSVRLLMVESGEAGIKTLADGRALARAANLATGYVPGRVSSLETVMMFAPRFFRSQLSMIADAVTKGGVAGGEARKNLLMLMSVGGLFTYGMNKMLGNETELDPRSPNFMRIRALGKDISVFGPWDTFFRGLTVAASQGPEQGAKYMIRSKASPVMGRVYDLMAGQTFQGDKLSADSVGDIIKSAAQLGRQMGPIGVQQAFQKGIPTNLGQVGGAAIEFAGMKATPLTPWEQMAIKRDDASKSQFGKPWDSLEPSQKKDLQDANPDLIWQTNKAAWEERTNIRDAFHDQQALLDESTPIGRDWIDSYHALRERESGAYQDWANRHPDEAKALVSSDTKDPNYRALYQYYDAIQQSTTPWGQLDPEQLSYRLQDLDASWTAAQSAFVERNTGIYNTPRVKEYKADQAKLRPYWDIRDQVWEKMQEGYPNLKLYRNDLEYQNALAQELRAQGTPEDQIQLRISQLPVIQYMARAVSELRLRYRRAHRDVDSLLLKWGYVSVPITQHGIPSPESVVNLSRQGRYQVRARR